MTKEDFILTERIVSMTEMGMAEKEILQNLIRTYLDPGFAMCFTCDPQVRQAWKRLGDWWLMNRDKFQKNIFIEKKEEDTNGDS
jgi:hypothetical protein